MEEAGSSRQIAQVMSISATHRSPLSISKTTRGLVNILRSHPFYLRRIFPNFEAMQNT
jgi:hypothetical protein